MAKAVSNNQQSFVNAALEVIAESGVEKLSMRKVASRLGVSAMAMYKHFDSKDALLSAALDEFIDRAKVLPVDPLSWEEWVEYMAQGMYAALSQEVSWVPVLGSVQLGATASSVTEAFVIRLMEEGFSAEQAMRGYFAVIQLVIGAACLRASILREDTSVDIAPVNRRSPGATGSEYVEIAAAVETVVALDQLAIGLPFVISALRNELG